MSYVLEPLSPRPNPTTRNPAYTPRHLGYIAYLQARHNLRIALSDPSSSNGDGADNIPHPGNTPRPKPGALSHLRALPWARVLAARDTENALTRAFCVFVSEIVIVSLARGAAEAGAAGPSSSSASAVSSGGTEVGGIKGACMKSACNATLAYCASLPPDTVIRIPVPAPAAHPPRPPSRSKRTDADLPSSTITGPIPSTSSASQTPSTAPGSTPTVTTTATVTVATPLLPMLITALFGPASPLPREFRILQSTALDAVACLEPMSPLARARNALVRAEGRMRMLSRTKMDGSAGLGIAEKGVGWGWAGVEAGVTTAAGGEKRRSALRRADCWVELLESGEVGWGLGAFSRTDQTDVARLFTALDCDEEDYSGDGGGHDGRDERGGYAYEDEDDDEHEHEDGDEDGMKAKKALPPVPVPVTDLVPPPLRVASPRPLVASTAAVGRIGRRTGVSAGAGRAGAASEGERDERGRRVRELGWQMRAERNDGFGVVADVATGTGTVTVAGGRV